MCRKARPGVGAVLQAMDDHLGRLGPAGLREAVATSDLPDHLWLAVEILCLGEAERESLVQALLRFSPLAVTEFADGSVLLRRGETGYAAVEPATAKAPVMERAIEAFVRPPFRPAPARRKALRLAR